MKKIILISVAIFISINLFSQSKIALVIGNSDYKDMPLKNPRNDANDLAVTLRSFGFDVIQKTDLNRRGIEDAIRKFKGKISPGDVALFYFSGHGTQVEGLNYLIPVNESISNEIDVKYNCVDAGFVLDHMEQARSGINIIILDACRNNPFKGHRSASRGFAFMSAPTGSIIAYSTSPGSVAQDGDGRNSPFTKNLIEKIKIPGLKIEEVFKEVRKDVAAETGRQQIPWESSSLMGDFYFKGSAATKVINNKTNNYKPPAEKYSATNESFSANSGTFTDNRDQQKYKWVRIGTQIWMAENLNYETENSWCYDNRKINCDKYGRLYKWDATKKACPQGWHLPSDDEWKILEGNVDSKYGSNSIEWNKEWGRGSDAGFNLKSKTGWQSGCNGSDNYGFAALPGGFQSANEGYGFVNIGHDSKYWTSLQHEQKYSWDRGLTGNHSCVFRSGFTNDGMGSIRCLKD